jgi:hypothetical protein
MGIKFGDPPVPKYVSSVAFHYGLAVGMVAVVAGVFLVDKLANFMYSRGYAKPFYIHGKRLHHVWLYAVVPAAYLAICSFMFQGSVQLVPGLQWYQLGMLLPLVGLCLAVDFLGDKRKACSTGLFRHEWVYALIPAYLLAFVVNVFL